jgi:hypothetical protein
VRSSGGCGTVLPGLLGTNQKPILFWLHGYYLAASPP